jgi:hypothetical protein
MTTSKQAQLEAEINKKREELAQLEQQLASIPTPQQRLLQLFNGCEIKLDLKEYPNSVFLFKDEHVFFEIEDSHLWCSFIHVWKIFEAEFGMEYNDIQSLIRVGVEAHFKMKGVTPCGHIRHFLLEVETHFKMKDKQKKQPCQEKE